MAADRRIVRLASWAFLTVSVATVAATPGGSRALATIIVSAVVYSFVVGDRFGAVQEVGQVRRRAVAPDTTLRGFLTFLIVVGVSVGIGLGVDGLAR